MISRLVGMLILCAGLFSCTSGDRTADSFGLELKRPAGYVEGRLLFKQRCSACHGENGEPSVKLYPPIKNSDYLKSHQEDLACIIRDGLQKDIEVNKKKYSMKMPANKDFSAEQIFHLINYINNSWGNSYGETTLEEVKKRLGNCDQ